MSAEPIQPCNRYPQPTYSDLLTDYVNKIELTKTPGLLAFDNDIKLRMQEYYKTLRDENLLLRSRKQAERQEAPELKNIDAKFLPEKHAELLENFKKATKITKAKPSHGAGYKYENLLHLEINQEDFNSLINPIIPDSIDFTDKTDEDDSFDIDSAVNQLINSRNYDLPSSQLSLDSSKNVITSKPESNKKVTFNKQLSNDTYNSIFASGIVVIIYHIIKLSNRLKLLLII